MIQKESYKTMTIKILNRFNSETVIYESEKETIREAVEEAVAKGVSLSYANLSYANLSYANLSYANLSYANLSYANLSDANLSYANLRSANLSYANLSDANLSYANLSDANLSDANLRQFKNDLFEILLNAPTEVAGLKAKLIAGEIDGSCYEPECGMACLVGTIAVLKDCHYNALEGISPDSGRPAEQWFFNIRPSCTPDKNAVAAITLEWINEFEQKMGRAVELMTANKTN
jgi:uncharacterized protein YjbI with pentapeptide repeats